MKRLLALVLTVLACAIAAPALAATPADAVADLSASGYYVEPGARSIDTDALSGVVSDARNSGSRFMVAILDEEPEGGPTTFADGVLDLLGEGTIIVLTRDGFVGYSSTEFDRSALEAALDRADDRGGSDLQYLTAFADALVGGAGTSEPAGSSGGGSGLLILLLVVGGLVLIVFFVVRRSKRSGERRAANEIESARNEIGTQLDAMANDILDLADAVKVSGSDEAQRHYQAASATYTSASDEFSAATDLQQLEAIADRLDEATWQLDAAEAIVEGRPVPPKPEKKEQARCFFDPTHRGPFEEAELRTSAGTRTVRVCARDAARLRSGDAPSPRMIDVGGRRVPAGAAPRSHGGLGLGAMDVLSILVGGMSQGVPTNWGRSRRSRGGLFGGGATRSGRASRSTRTQRRSSSSRTRSASRSSKPRARGGRRRRR